MVNMMYFFNKAFITSIYIYIHTHIYIYIYIHTYIYIGLGIVEVVGALELLKDLTG